MSELTDDLARVRGLMDENVAIGPEPMIQFASIALRFFNDHAAAIEAMERDAEQTKAAAERLCEIYFNIAAEAIGEDAVRTKRDAAIDAAMEKSK